MVEVPAGTFLTGPIRLKSNITLQVDEGATLKFATDPTLYPLVKTRYEGVEIMNYSPLIAAYGCHDVKITGKGTLDGQGSAWWKWARSSSGRKTASTQAAATEAAAPEGLGGEEGAAPAVQATATMPGGGSGQGVGGNLGARKLMLMYTADREGKYPVEQRVFGETHPGFRPCFIEPWECKGVTIEGVTVKQSPFWNLHPVYCDGVTIKDVTVQGNGPNTDGCDPDSCSNVTIEGCHFATGDDCIAIKSGRDGDGLRGQQGVREHHGAELRDDGRARGSVDWIGNIWRSAARAGGRLRDGRAGRGDSDQVSARPRRGVVEVMALVLPADRDQERKEAGRDAGSAVRDSEGHIEGGEG